jgi:hypothetical protein
MFDREDTNGPEMTFSVVNLELYKLKKTWNPLYLNSGIKVKVKWRVTTFNPTPSTTHVIQREKCLRQVVETKM